MKLILDLMVDELEDYFVAAEDYNLVVKYGEQIIYSANEMESDLRHVLKVIEKHAKENR